MEDKIMALAKFLEIEPALIQNNYSEYFTINERTVKRGKTPEQLIKLAKDFRSILDTGMQGLITATIISNRTGTEIDEIYGEVKESLKPLADKSKIRAMQVGRMQFKPTKETAEDIYLRLKQENAYVENILHHLITLSASNLEYSDSLRRAWLGQPVSDTRKDETIDDGEYLVLTDSEADDWEEEHLRSLFQDMTSEVNGSLSQYLDEDKFVEDNSGNRGENINSHDGREEGIAFEGTTYYIYRSN